MMNLTHVFKGAYVYESILGKGAFGVVALASGAAVKWIQSTRSVEDKYQARELEALQACRHPNVVCMIEHEYHNGDLYIVLESWMCSLFVYLRRKVIPLEQSSWMLKHLLSAVAHVHACGFLHRDVKPANILLRQDALCLTDFGHAVRAPDVSGTPAQSTNVFTRWYRPPEVALLQPYTSSADVFSVGCVFVEIVRNALEKDPFPLFYDSERSYPISGDALADGEHINNIFRMLGSPTASDRVSLRLSESRLGAYANALPNYERPDLGFPATQTAWVHAMLSLNPTDRISAATALEWIGPA